MLKLRGPALAAGLSGLPCGWHLNLHSTQHAAHGRGGTTSGRGPWRPEIGQNSPKTNLEFNTAGPGTEGSSAHLLWPWSALGWAPAAVSATMG